MKRHRVVVWSLLGILFVSLAVAGGVGYYRYARRMEQERLLLLKRKAMWHALTANIDSLAARFEGRAGIVVKDLKTGWEYSRNDQERMPAASLVKLPIMAVCFHARNEGRMDFNQELLAEGENKVSGSGDLDKMQCSLRQPVCKVVELMVTKSDNTATNMLISSLGYDYLNEHFKEAGLANTTICRKMMDFSQRDNGVDNFTTSRDMANILEKLYRAKYEDREVSGECIALLKGQKMRDRLPALLPKNTVVAHKTGLERSVCHDVGIIYTPKGDFLVSVLTYLAPNSRTAKRFIARVALEVYNAYQEL